jgi:Family of unknown function (DUF6088)
MSAQTTRKLTLEQSVLRTIDKQEGVVILRRDFAGLGSAAQLSRTLAKLVESKALVRVGHGIYAKTRQNRFTGELTPAAPFETIAAQAFRRLGIDVGHGRLAREYNEGKSTQVPVQPVVTTGKRRISRKIRVGSKIVLYERTTERRRKKDQP